MAKVYAFLANGFETVEALCVVDCLKRAGVEAILVSTEETLNVVSAQNIGVVADIMLSECDFESADILFLPGGGPGTKSLKANEVVLNAVKKHYEGGKKVAAICAAPSILGKLGILSGRRATCFPGFEEECIGATMTGERVVTDGNVTTGKGMGTSMDMGLRLVEILCGKEASEKVAKTSQYI